jgi:hypothetical protein
MREISFVQVGMRQSYSKFQSNAHLFLLLMLLVLFFTAQFSEKIVEQVFAFAHFIDTFIALIAAIFRAKV